MPHAVGIGSFNRTPGTRLRVSRVGLGRDPDSWADPRACLRSLLKKSPRPPPGRSRLPSGTSFRPGLWMIQVPSGSRDLLFQQAPTACG